MPSLSIDPDLAVVTASTPARVATMKTLRPVDGLLAPPSKKNVRSPSPEVWNWPGARRERSDRLSNWSFRMALRSFCHGHTNSESTAISSRTGQLIPSTGRTKRLSGTPLANQIVISLARYMRDSVATTATNSDSASIVERWPSPMYASSSMTSCGEMRPPAACPRFLMNMMVSTMVRMMTSVAPKLWASSRRNVESNNIVGSS